MPWGCILPHSPPYISHGTCLAGRVCRQKRLDHLCLLFPLLISETCDLNFDQVVVL